MYRPKNKKQISFKDFYLPFGGSLKPNNRWIILSKLLPWKEFEETYADQFSDNGMGAPAKSARIALGALLIKEKLRIIDEETVEQIKENPYLQYLIGMEGYQDEAPFDPSMMVHFRKRISGEMLKGINERIFTGLVKKTGNRSTGTRRK